MDMLNAYTAFHVVVSLVGIGAGFAVVLGLLTSRLFERWTTIFLITTAATSVTGFLFPFHGFLPSYGVGIVSLIILAFAFMGRARMHASRGWRKTYVITATTALYLNVFVLVAQMFQKIPALHALAPTQADPPFQIAEAGVLVVFVLLGVLATRKFDPMPVVVRARAARA
jgi:hypothetical protein